MAAFGSNASFKLFSQWLEQPRQRTFPASVERVFVTLSRHLGQCAERPVRIVAARRQVF
jgi:hypothetical protein